MQQILIFGCGETGLRIARLCLKQPFPVAGVVRSATGTRRLHNAGVESFLIDLDIPQTATGLPTQAAQLFYLVPPPDHGEDDLRLQNALRILEQTGLPARILYISTTGVYGDCRGRWIDETAPLAPATLRARRRVAAETLLRDWCARHGVDWVILRVASIYGPNRLPLERLHAAAPTLQPADSGYLNRIHIDDLARICCRAMREAPQHSLYNVSDGNPSSFTDYLLLLAELAGLPEPPLVSAADSASQIDAGLMSFLRESKRIRNDKLLQDLKLTLLYPDARSGILASLATAAKLPG